MSLVTRSLTVAAVALALAAPRLPAQIKGTGNFQWYLGGQGGALVFRTPNQTRGSMPVAGGNLLIISKRTGLMLSVEEGIGDQEVTSFTDDGGVQTATFNDIRKYSATLMAFPFKSPAQPYFGLGAGIIHLVNPTPTNATASAELARQLGSSGFISGLAGLQLRAGPFMAFGQYQITSSSGTKHIVDADGNAVGFGEMLVGPTHTFSVGLRIGLGNAREGIVSR